MRTDHSSTVRSPLDHRTIRNLKLRQTEADGFEGRLILEVQVGLSLIGNTLSTAYPARPEVPSPNLLPVAGQT